MRLFGLIGYPLSHSFSKKYFTDKFEKEGLTGCRYELFPLSSINELGNLVQEHPELEGLNVTIPYKQQVLPYLFSMQGIPEGIHACNCIKIKDGKWWGYNTDVTGFEKSLAPLLQPHHTKALILGNGGVTEAIRYVLEKADISYAIVSRTLRDGSALTYPDITEAVMNEHPLIINTTPVGTFPNTTEAPAIPYRFLTDRHLLYDLVYNPEKTLFLQKGEERGAAIKNGYEMLVIQAEESWKIWNNNE